MCETLRDKEFQETLDLLRGAGWIAHADEYEAAVSTIATLQEENKKLKEEIEELKYAIMDLNSYGD